MVLVLAWFDQKKYIFKPKFTLFSCDGSICPKTKSYKIILSFYSIWDIYLWYNSKGEKGGTKKKCIMIRGVVKSAQIIYTWQIRSLLRSCFTDSSRAVPYALCARNLELIPNESTNIGIPLLVRFQLVHYNMHKIV